MSSSGLGRKFHFIREIASGGFGSVYLAKVIHGDGFARLAAIKLLHPKWSENEEIASRMRDEARLLGWLRHKNIVEVLDLTKIAGRVAVIMEYLEAVDAKLIVNWAVHDQREIPVGVCLEICAAIASALDAAYNRPPYAGEKPLRVIHRDIKPSNVMVDTGGTVKVLDFGVARADFAERESKTQEMSFGSIEYMPPERLFFEPDTDKSDVYSLGAMLYEMLALEKFGKAKLRFEQMEDFFEERWDVLRARHSFPSPDIEADVKLLMHDMLAFDAHERPNASDVAACMRTIARRVPAESLAEWAEVVIPPLVQAFSNRKLAKNADSLVDQTLPEDSRGFIREDETSDIMPPVDALPSLEPPTEEEEDLDQSGRFNDENWQKLKQRTLADIEEHSQPPPPQRQHSRGKPPQQAPKTRSPLGAPAAPAAAKSAKSAKSAKPKSEPSLGAAPGRAMPGQGMGALAAVSPAEEEQPGPATTGVWKSTRRKKEREPEPEPETEPPSVETEEVVPRLELEPGPSGSTRILGVMVPMALLFGFSLMVLGVVALLLAVASAKIMSDGSPESTASTSVGAPPAVEAEVTTAATGSAPTLGPAAAPAGSAVFKSALPNTKKVTVRCTKGSGEGASEAFVTDKDPGECTVTAIDTARKRATFVIPKTEAKTYTCFADAAKDCK